MQPQQRYDTQSGTSSKCKMASTNMTVFYELQDHTISQIRTNWCDVMYSLLGHPLPIATLK